MRLPSSSDNMSINVQIYTLDERIPNFSHVFYAPFLHVPFCFATFAHVYSRRQPELHFWHHCCSLDHTTSKTSLSTSHKFIHQHNTLPSHGKRKRTGSAAPNRAHSRNRQRHLQQSGHHQPQPAGVRARLRRRSSRSAPGSRKCPPDPHAPKREASPLRPPRQRS